MRALWRFIRDWCMKGSIETVHDRLQDIGTSDNGEGAAELCGRRQEPGDNAEGATVPHRGAVASLPTEFGVYACGHDTTEFVGASMSDCPVCSGKVEANAHEAIASLVDVGALTPSDSAVATEDDTA